MRNDNFSSTYTGRLNARERNQLPSLVQRGLYRWEFLAVLAGLAWHPAIPLINESQAQPSPTNTPSSPSFELCFPAKCIYECCPGCLAVLALLVVFPRIIEWSKWTSCPRHLDPAAIADHAALKNLRLVDKKFTTVAILFCPALYLTRNGSGFKRATRLAEVPGLAKHVRHLIYHNHMMS